MKKHLMIIISIILLISTAAGCSQSQEHNNVSSKAKTTVSETASSGEIVIVTMDSEIPAVSSTTANSTSKSATLTTTSATSSTTSKPSRISNTKKSTSKVTSKAHKTTKAKPKKKHTTKQNKTNSETHSETQNICYITIECKSILDNMNKLNEGHESFVPKNGIILDRTKCAISENNTVYDVLSSACGSNGIKLTSRSTIYGIYVSGINNLDEFDCGQSSGWVYTVNSKSPPKSCEKYTVSSGDEIIFKYVC
ncbi:MAG: DUF4430 domain-containing protein [Eubacterium sp.]|nr:DUF4430 domain-containing protein [Eubacterium sp.]